MVANAFCASRHFVASVSSPPEADISSAMPVVVGGRSDDGDIVKILGGGADHRRAADIDVLDDFVKVDAWLAGRLFEGVEIDHHHVDGLNAVFA